MIRLEIIANHSVEENILEALKKDGVGKYYTRIPTIFGVGSSGPRMGDAIWPEENFALVIWCDDHEARVIIHTVGEIKKQFPDEGIKVFGLGGGKDLILHKEPAAMPTANAETEQPAPAAERKPAARKAKPAE